MATITERVKEIKDDIEKHSIYPEKVKLVAVTKYPIVDKPKLEELMTNGIFDFGENRVQVLEAKRELLEEKKNDINWNFIGNLQKNKVKYIIDYVHMIHSINRMSLAEEVEKRVIMNRNFIKNCLN